MRLHPCGRSPCYRHPVPPALLRSGYRACSWRPWAAGASATTDKTLSRRSRRRATSALCRAPTRHPEGGCVRAHGSERDDLISTFRDRFVEVPEEIFSDRTGSPAVPFAQPGLRRGGRLLSASESSEELGRRFARRHRSSATLRRLSLRRLRWQLPLRRRDCCELWPTFLPRDVRAMGGDGGQSQERDGCRH